MAAKTLGEMFDGLNKKALEIDENFVGIDNLIPTTSWVDLAGRSWRNGDPSPLNDAHIVFLLAPQEDGHLNIYCYPGKEKDGNGRGVRFARYRMYEPSAGLAANIRVPVQVETMHSDNWESELVEELLSLNDEIMEREAARAGDDDETPPSQPDVVDSPS